MTEPVPLVHVGMTRLVCHEQEDTEPLIDTEDDEPYVLVVSVACPPPEGGLLAGVPSAEVFRIGPFDSVDAGDRRDAPPNVVWGLNGQPAPMPDADRALFLVALLENDNADPARVARALAGPAQATVAGLWANAMAREGLDPAERFALFRRSFRDSVQETLGVVRMTPLPGGALDPDDLIGPVQELRFTDAELSEVIRTRRPVERTLQFRGDDASYDLTFALRPGVDTVAELLERVTGQRRGSVAEAARRAGRARPVSLREWRRELR